MSEIRRWCERDCTGLFEDLEFRQFRNKSGFKVSLISTTFASENSLTTEELYSRDDSGKLKCFLAPYFVRYGFLG